MKHSRHAWWTPSAWVSTILFEIASRAPNDVDMLIAAAYGIVEICGLKRATKPLLEGFKNWIKTKVGR